MTTHLYWRSDPEIQLHMRIDLQGRDGSWKGMNSGTFNFGSPTPSCGKAPGLGNQNVTIRVELQCIELPDDTFLIKGTLEVLIGASQYITNLKNVPLECSDDGPNCTAAWPFLWVVGLGTAQFELAGTGLT